MSAPRIERREFLKFSLAAGGGLLIGFSLPGADMFATAQAQSTTVFMPNAFLRIGTDDRVTVIVNHSEMGQGVYTALPMLLAEELDADWNKVGFESAPVFDAISRTVAPVKGWPCGSIIVPLNTA